MHITRKYAMWILLLGSSFPTPFQNRSAFHHRRSTRCETKGRCTSSASLRKTSLPRLAKFCDRPGQRETKSDHEVPPGDNAVWKGGMKFGPFPTQQKHEKNTYITLFAIKSSHLYGTRLIPILYRKLTGGFAKAVPSEKKNHSRSKSHACCKAKDFQWKASSLLG